LGLSERLNKDVVNLSLVSNIPIKQIGIMPLDEFLSLKMALKQYDQMQAK
jgi:hypothetical protein